MKILIYILFTLMIWSSVNAQELKTGGQLNGISYYVRGIKFTNSNVRNTEPRFCKNEKRIYFLEGLELTEEIFLKLDLKQKNVVDNGALYAYQFRNQDTANCIERINLFLKINIPIELNGVELKEGEKEKVLKQIKPNQLVAINNKCSLFRGRVIVVQTM